MSEKESSSSASRHYSRAGLPVSGGGKDGPPPPFTPAARSAPPIDDVIHSSAGDRRTLSPGREVDRAPPFMGPSSPAYLSTGEVRSRSPRRRRQRGSGQESLRRRSGVDELTTRSRLEDFELTTRSRSGVYEETFPPSRQRRSRVEDDESTITTPRDTHRRRLFYDDKTVFHHLDQRNVGREYSPSNTRRDYYLNETGYHQKTRRPLASDEES